MHVFGINSLSLHRIYALTDKPELNDDIKIFKDSSITGIHGIDFHAFTGAGSFGPSGSRRSENESC